MTLTENSIVAMRKAKAQGVIVPLLVDLLKSPLDIKTKEDADFLHDLALRGILRDEERLTKKPMFSPSALASCMRKVYLQKHWKELGFERVELPNPEAHMIFMEGDWLHLKWQFALWRLSKVNPRFKLIGCEIRLESKKKDHGGTVDVICTVDDVPYIVDVKGLNYRGWSSAIRGTVSDDYRIQVPDYMMLFNNSRDSEIIKIRKRIGRIETGILLVQHKGGPDRDHPIALHEVHLSYDENLPLVQRRLKELRDYEEKAEIPPPECVSTRQYQFQGCKFADYCKAEVRQRQKETADADPRNPKEFKLKKAGRSRTRRTGGI